MGIKLNPFTGKLDVVDSPSGDFSDVELDQGTATAPSISFNGDPNTGIYSPGADQLAISTNGTGRLFVDANGDVSLPRASGGYMFQTGGSIRAGIRSNDNNELLFNRGTDSTGMVLTAIGVGIGTTAPSFDLMIDKDSNSIVTSYTRSFNTGSSAGGRVSAASAVGKIAISAYSAANSVWPSSTVLGSDSGFTGGLNIYQEGANPIVLWTNGFERARIDDSGRLLVGTSSARSQYGVTPKSQVEGTDNTSSFGAIRNSNDAGGAYLLLGKSRGTATGSATVVQSGDNVGAVYFQGADGSDLEPAAAIECIIDGTPGANDMPGRLVFSTNPGSPATAPVERMRIQNDGDVLINTVTEGAGAGFSTKLAVSGADTLLVKTAGIAASSAAPARFWHDAASGDNLFVNFATDATYTNRAFIDYNRSAGQVRYNVTSDRRLKSNIQDSESALNVLNQIKVRSYIWTETGYSIPHGFIAQELNEAVPDAVRAGDDGDEVVDIWSVDNAKLVPLLTKALQEAMTEIESLKARVTALEP